MNKYKLENNIDFYKELYKSLYEEKSGLDDNLLNDENDNDENNLCLITNLPLSDNHVILKCGHKFNYEPLYKDIYNYKRKFNNLEQVRNRLKTNQLRCPYCRNVQDELLPYYDNLGYSKVNGVNVYDISNNNECYNYINPDHQCKYQINAIDASGNIISSQCPHFGYVHYILKSKYNDTTKYCYSHKVIVIKNIKTTIKEKIKAAKLEEKLKKKEEKLNKLKETLNNNNIFCNAILKTGNKKGLPCSVTCYKNDLCKRHFNLQNKQIIESESNQDNIVI